MRNSCPAVPTWGCGILYTEFIQICTMFVVDFDRQHHIHLNSLVFQTKFVSTGKCEKYRFHGESSQNWRVSACRGVLLFPLRVPQGCPSDPRSCACHTMWSNAAAGSACSPRARGTGKRRDFSTFTDGRQAVHPHCKILKMQKSALSF